MTQLVPSSSIPTASQSSAQVIIGNRFRPDADMTLRSIWWFRWLTTDASPTRLVIYHASDSAIVLDVGVTADSSPIGWKSQNVADTVLSGGVDYICAVLWASGSTTHISGWATAPPTPGAGYTVVGARYAQPSTSTSTPPTTTSTWELAAVSVSSDPAGTGAGGTPATSGDAEVVSAGWLSSDPDVNQHQADGLPWRTDANVTTLKGEAEGASGFAAIKGVVDTIATSVGTGLRTAVTTLTTNLATANAALVHAATTWSDALATALQAMSDDFASFGASKPAQGGGDFGAGTFPSNVGTLVWTMLDETDFVGSIAWAQPADVYVLSITTRPHGQPLNLTDGVHTIYRCGWWTPLNGSFARQRSYIDFEDSHLTIGAERMPGVLVSLQPGGEGHIQAWALT